MREILLLEPVFREKLWGGSRLSAYGYRLPDKRIGEVCAISALPGCNCKILNASANGTTLRELFRNQRESFGRCASDSFPFCVKLVSTDMDTEIVVHPDDAYSKMNENGSNGQMEYVYILSCPEHATMILGQNLRSRQEAEILFKRGNLSTITREIPIHKGDFFRIEPGTAHGFKAGTVFLSISENSDIAYRISGNKSSETGNGKDIEKALDVMRFPSNASADELIYTYRVDFALVKRFAQCAYFIAEHLQVKGSCCFRSAQTFTCYTVIAGNGTINGNALHTGDSILVPADFGSYELNGDFELIRCFPNM